MSDKKPVKIATPTMKKPGKTAAKTRRRQRAKTIGSCFILMPFKEPFDTYYSAIIEPAVLSAQLEPLRGDSLFRPSPIMADVWQMIQDAKVLVAEMTEKNANVFYELGLAHALGKPVVLISETIDDVPFDLQPLRVILYNKSDPAWGVRLKGDLVASLEETIEDVAKAVPPMFRKIVKSQAPEDSDLSLRLFELERRVAAMSPHQLLLGAGSPISRERSVDWASVQKFLRQRKAVQTLRPKFMSRPHAVAWAMAQLERQPTSIVRNRLQKVLRGNEGEVVFELAIEGINRLTKSVERTRAGRVR